MSKEMTQEEFCRLQEMVGLNGRELAGRLSVTEQSIAYWRRGKRPVPGPVQAYMRLAAAVTVALEGK